MDKEQELRKLLDYIDDKLEEKEQADSNVAYENPELLVIKFQLFYILRENESELEKDLECMENEYLRIGRNKEFSNKYASNIVDDEPSGD